MQRSKLIAVLAIGIAGVACADASNGLASVSSDSNFNSTCVARAYGKAVQLRASRLGSKDSYFEVSGSLDDGTLNEVTISVGVRDGEVGGGLSAELDCKTGELNELRQERKCPLSTHCGRSRPIADTSLAVGFTRANASC